MYGNASQFEAEKDCGGRDPNAAGLGLCGEAGAIVRPFTDRIKPKVPPRPGVASCPNGGVFTGTIAPGDYVCDAMVFKEHLTVSGTGAARFWPICQLNFQGRSNTAPHEINKNQSPLRVQIYYASPPASCVSTDSKFCSTVLFGMLYAPGLTIDCPGSSQAYVYGAVLANIYNGTGNQFEFYWDQSTQYDLNTGKFRIHDWRECPASVTSC
jgi:hypothetical protein